MVQLVTPAVARRVRAYSGPGFGPRSFGGIGIGIGISVMPAPVGGSTFNGNFAALFTGVLQYLRSDLGLTTTGSIVNAWADQSGNGANVTEGTATVGIGTVTTGMGGHAGIAGGAGGQYGTFTLDLPPPGTTPTFFWGVARLLTAPGGQGWLTSSSSAAALLYANGGANLTAYNNASPGAAVAAVGSWGRFEALFANSASDYVRFGTPAALSPGAAGNADPLPTRSLFAQSNATNFGNWELLALVTLNNQPSGAQLAAAAAAAQTFYTTGVAI